MNKQIPVPLAIFLLIIVGLLLCLVGVTFITVPLVREQNERAIQEREAMLRIYETMTYSEVVSSRGHYYVETIDFKTCVERDDVGLCWIDDVQVKVINNSSVALPSITFRINRYIQGQNEVSWSRTNYEFYDPLMPGESRIINIHAVGSLDSIARTNSINAIIEPRVSKADRHFFPELKDKYD